MSKRNDAREAAGALEDALIRGFGALPRGNADIALRAENSLLYASELYRALARSYGLQFVLPQTQAERVAESSIGTLQLERVWQHRLETYDEAKAAIAVWVTHLQQVAAAFAPRHIPLAELHGGQAELSA